MNQLICLFFKTVVSWCLCITSHKFWCLYQLLDCTVIILPLTETSVTFYYKGVTISKISLQVLGKNRLKFIT